MGFFFTEAGAAARKKTQAQKRVAPGRVTEAQQALLTCQQCPLDHERLQSPKMEPTGSTRPLVYVLGNFPSKREDEEGSQFAGASGDFLRDRLTARMPRHWASKIRWNNVLRCKTKKEVDPAPLEIACCKRLQTADIEQTKPLVILGCGQTVLTHLLGASRHMEVWRGKRIPVKIGTHTCWYYPINHPMEMLQLAGNKKYGTAHVAAFERDLERLVRDVEAGLPEAEVEDEKNFLKGIETLQVYGREGFEKVESALGEFYNDDHANDIETNGIRPYIRDSKILTMAVGMYDRTFAFPWMHPEAKWSAKEQKDLAGLIREYLLGPGIKFAHGAAFEQEWFRFHLGAEVIFETKWGDTMAQAHVIDERKPPKSQGISLDSLTQLHFGFRIKDQSSVDLTRMETEPLRKILPYNGMDTKYTHLLSILQADTIEQEKLERAYGAFNNATPSFVSMQAKGLTRNIDAIETLHKELTEETKKAERNIANNEDVQRFVAAGNEFNPASNPNLVKFFRTYLKLGDGTTTSVDEEALTGFKHPAAKGIIALRSVDKRMDYVAPLRDGGKYVYPDGKVHSKYGNMVTVTGRAACEDPNGQNYPRRAHKEIRRVIGCPPGHKLVSMDYGQLEARIIAAIANDKNLKEAIWEGQDIHGYWTDILGKEFVPKMWKDTRKKVRDDIKQYWTFGNFYGQTLDGMVWYIAQQWDLDTSRKSMGNLVDRFAPYFDEFWSMYSGVKKYHETLLSNYEQFGYIETATGFRRHEPMALNEIINAPFQGTAGHLVIDAQIRCARVAHFEERPSLQPVMNIHDDLTFYIPEATLERDIEDAAKLMISGSGYEFLNDVPLSVEVSMGDNWCDKEEIATFTTDRNGNFYEVVK